MTILGFRIERRGGEPGLGLVSQEQFRQQATMDGITFSHGPGNDDAATVVYDDKQVDIKPGRIRSFFMNLSGRRTEVTVTHEPISEDF